MGTHLEFAGEGILLDVEGTTSSVQFVYDQMFPYVRRELAGFLQVHWADPAVVDACAQIVRDADQERLWDAADTPALQRNALRSHVLQLMDADVKTTGLKMLQGLIWKSGFFSGELVAHVYADVVPAWTSWRARGRDLRIYSSGSVQAQKLFFGHTQAGDLLPLLTAHYDTTIGSKRESSSYHAIAAEWGCPAAGLLFLSDVVEELDAARTAGMQTGLVVRPGNAPVSPDQPHPVVQSLAEIDLPD